MTTDEFRTHAHALVDWMADYLEHVRDLPVRSSAAPGDIFRRIPETPPAEPEPFEQVFRDFTGIIVPGMTHWQHPSFFAYFPANASPASILAEMLTATMGAQCMSWVTSPAATELEERMMAWLRGMIGLPASWSGVIQDTASTATLCSLLTAREVRSGYAVNQRGFTPADRYTVYCSQEAHSSVEKGAKIAGFGKEQVRKVEVDDAYAMVPEALERAVRTDREQGLVPLAVVAAIGSTGSTAIDPLRAIGTICTRERLWLHVDAAYAGTALLLPEYRWMIDGIEGADSFVFNPHKWMFTNFDCSAYFVRDEEALVRTFEILPEYLRTTEGHRVTNYRDWGIQLGRRFRALKLWFVIREFGLRGLQERVREHCRIAHDLAERVRAADDFELLAPSPLSLVCFRYHPRGTDDEAALNALNAELLERLNCSGTLYLSHTKLRGRFTLRLVVAQTAVSQQDVDAAWERIQRTAREAGTGAPRS